MNGKELRIAVAEACGWSKREVSHGALVHWHSREWRGPNNEVGLPDYPNDLNAMREVEVEYIIPNGLWDEYASHLKRAMRGGERFWGQASARQRCEAFLRTLGKRKD